MVVHKGISVCTVIEGHDGACKGGSIKTITERVSPRVLRVERLPAPTERQKSQMHIERFQSSRNRTATRSRTILQFCPGADLHLHPLASPGGRG